MIDFLAHHGATCAMLRTMQSPAGYSFVFLLSSSIRDYASQGGVTYMSISSHRANYLTHLHNNMACFETLIISRIAPVTKHMCLLSFSDNVTPATDLSWWST